MIHPVVSVYYDLRNDTSSDDITEYTVTLFLKKPNLFAGKPIGCQRNEECRNTEICVSGTCINPCLVDDPCGANAECYPQDHRSEW